MIVDGDRGCVGIAVGAAAAAAAVGSSRVDGEAGLDHVAPC